MNAKIKLNSYAVYAEARDKVNMNDITVAKEANVSPATISAWKTGEYTPKIDKLMRIASVVGIPVMDLIEVTK